ncbi:ROK family protein [Microcella alkalica]|uniref:Glucokinase n=1 Tax=Microcella alkalica TaxID=355930 RepID=A0A839EDA8_9MICO|nr:ROK family protein [Microcella alkalica]MBA8849083.1 glucokinase [Microcella alkalica]
MTSEAVLAVDIGGTKTAAALVDRDGSILASSLAATRADEGPDAVVSVIADLAQQLRSALPGARALGIGIGTAGVVDVAAGRIIGSTDTFRDWTGTPLADLVAQRMGGLLGGDGPVVVEVQNDVDAHALGESRYGAARGAASALVVAVGTGVGGAIVLDGSVHRGARHVAGDIGHVPVPGAEHLACTCGRSGHLEAIGSGPGVVAHFVSLGGEPAIRTARGVAEAAERGDERAIRALEGSATAVGRALAGAAALLDPERVVLLGGVTGAGPRWWSAMSAGFLAERIHALSGLAPEPGELGGDAGLLGAAWSAWAALERISS